MIISKLLMLECLLSILLTIETIISDLGLVHELQ